MIPVQCDPLTAAAETVFDYQSLMAQAKDLAKDYRNASPFPCIELDSTISKTNLRKAIAAFPHSDDPRWSPCYAEGDVVRNKVAMWDIRKIPAALNQIIFEMNSGPFIEFLEELTGIAELVTDPHLFGAGIHQSLPGGKLDVHVDHNINTRINLYRRVSVVLFMNEDWKEHYNGALEFWSADISRCVKKIEPLSGRMAVFTNSETSFHGHPKPLSCPTGVVRRSIASWYLSATPDPSYDSEPHKASFKPREKIVSQGY